MHRYLLDTNVVSETRKRNASPVLMAFLGGLDSEQAHISVLTLGELRRGVELKRSRDPGMSAEFEGWLNDIEREFADRTYLVTAEIAHRWGEITADRSRPAVDTLIAATALVHGLTVVTRNGRDFSGLGVHVLNPWA